MQVTGHVANDLLSASTSGQSTTSRAVSESRRREKVEVPSHPGASLYRLAKARASSNGPRLKSCGPPSCRLASVEAKDLVAALMTQLLLALQMLDPDDSSAALNALALLPLDFGFDGDS